MAETTTTPSRSPLFGGGWSDPLEDEVRGRVRAFIEAIFEEELSAALGRGRYERAEDVGAGWRNGHRDRQVIGTFGAETVRVPRARLVREDGGTAEWRSKALRRYQRLTPELVASIDRLTTLRAFAKLDAPTKGRLKELARSEAGGSRSWSATMTPRAGPRSGGRPPRPAASTGSRATSPRPRGRGRA
ncbi:MAG: transposase [Spirochaetia bacterium]